MGNWQLEVVRMALYISFPVGIFYWFNKPGTFDEYVKEIHGKYMQIEPGAKEKVDAFIEEYNRDQIRQRFDELETQIPSSKQ